MVDEEYTEELDEHVMFACPECGREIADDITVCPGCGAIFEEEAPPSMGIKEGQMAPPEDYVEDQGPAQLATGDELGISPTPEGEEEIASSEDDVSEYEPKESGTNLEPESEISARADTGIPPMDTKSDTGIPQKSIPDALSDYSERRKKRNLYGAIFLGMGIVLFVLLWLVVVYDVLVTETEDWFGVDIILILVGAGILFILGLYMILSYPKSSLSELLSNMTTTRPSFDSGLGSNPSSSRYKED